MSNFDFLKSEMCELFSLATLAEDMLYVDAASCIVKQCIIVEKIVNIIISNEKLTIESSSSLNSKINLLYKKGIIDLNLKKNLDIIRKGRNIAAHNGTGSQVEALTILERTYTFVTWFYINYSRLSSDIPSFSIPERKSVVISVEEIERQFSQRLKEIENSIVLLNDNRNMGDGILGYAFNGVKYTNIYSLSKALLMDINSAKKHIKTGTLTSYLREIDADLAVKCFELEKNEKVTNREIYIFLHEMTLEHDGLIWNEHSWQSFDELGQEGIKAFCKTEQYKIDWINKMYSDGILELYCEMKNVNRKVFNTRGVKLAVEELLYELCDIRYFYWEGYRFKTEEGLIKYLDAWKCVNPDRCKSIINQLEGMNVFNVWIERYYTPIDRGYQMLGQSMYRTYKAGHTQFFERYNNRMLEEKFCIKNTPRLMKMEKDTIVCFKHNLVMFPTNLKICKRYGNTFYRSIGVMYCSRCKQYYCSENTQKIIQRENIPIEVINEEDK